MRSRFHGLRVAVKETVGHGTSKLRRRAIAEVIERDRKISEVASELGIGSPETLRDWVKQARATPVSEHIEPESESDRARRRAPGRPTSPRFDNTSAIQNTYGYDTNGRRTSNAIEGGATVGYTWNKAGRLVGRNNPTATFTYNGDGLRTGGVSSFVPDHRRQQRFLDAVAHRAGHPVLDPRHHARGLQRPSHGRRPHRGP